MNCCSASAGFGSPAARHRNTASWARVQGASGAVSYTHLKLVFNPDSEQRKVSDLDVTVVSTRKKVVMIEARCV